MSIRMNWGNHTSQPNFDMKVHSCMLLHDQLASINLLLFTFKKKKKQPRFSDGFNMCLLYNMWLLLFLSDPQICREVTSLCTKLYTDSDGHRELCSLLLHVRVKSTAKKRITHIVESVKCCHEEEGVWVCIYGSVSC